MTPEEMWTYMKTPGDVFSCIVHVVDYYGSTTIPQKVIDSFGGYPASEHTRLGTALGWRFKIDGTYSVGPSMILTNGTVKVTQFGLTLYDDTGRKQSWVDFEKNGDSEHYDMHYQEAGWERGRKVFASRNPDRFWNCVSMWQSHEFSTFLKLYEQDGSCLYNISGGC